MLFDTPIYLLFLIAVVLVYWQLKWRQQNKLLLVASYFFTVGGTGVFLV